MAIPTTLPISLSTVITEIGLPASSSLADCFAAASGTFNGTYAKTGQWLTEFRGYVHSSPCNTTNTMNFYPSSGQASSGAGTCPSGGTEQSYYFYPSATNVSTSSTVTTDSNGCNVFNGGNLWYRVRSNGGEASTFYSIRINTTGGVTGKIACT